jgi:hypothetical protein
MLASDEHRKGNWPDTAFPVGSQLALVNGAFWVVNGTNGLLDVSDIMSLEFGEPQVTFGSRNLVTGLASPTAGMNRLGAIEFNDSEISGSYNLHLFLYGVFSMTITDSAPKNGSYTETLKLKKATVVGDGYFQDVPFTAKGTISASGKENLPF